MFTKDDIRTLVDVVIVYLTWVDLSSCIIQTYAAFNAAQVEEKNYCDWHPTNQFLSLTIEIFRYLHK
jgi:hypothetical protein